MSRALAPEGCSLAQVPIPLLGFWTGSKPEVQRADSASLQSGLEQSLSDGRAIRLFCEGTATDSLLI